MPKKANVATICSSKTSRFIPTGLASPGKCAPPWLFSTAQKPCYVPSYTQSQIEDCSVRNGFGIAVSVIQGPCGMAVSVPGRPSTLLGTAVPVPNQSLNAHRDPSPSPSTLIGTHVPVPTQSRPSPDQSRPCRRLPKTAKDCRRPSKTAEDQPRSC